mgnify:CR=1 FL=1
MGYLQYSEISLNYNSMKIYERSIAVKLCAYVTFSCFIESEIAF